VAKMLITRQSVPLAAHFVYTIPILNLNGTIFDHYFQVLTSIRMIGTPLALDMDIKEISRRITDLEQYGGK
jgi:hypothetical protein